MSMTALVWDTPPTTYYFWPIIWILLRENNAVFKSWLQQLLPKHAETHGPCEATLQTQHIFSVSFSFVSVPSLIISPSHPSAKGASEWICFSLQVWELSHQVAIVPRPPHSLAHVFQSARQQNQADRSCAATGARCAEPRYEPTVGLLGHRVAGNALTNPQSRPFSSACSRTDEFRFLTSHGLHGTFSAGAVTCLADSRTAGRSWPPARLSPVS